MRNELKINHWYRWTKTEQLPGYWTKRMNFLLDGKPHKCIAETAYNAKGYYLILFEDDPNRTDWAFNEDDMKYFEEVDIKEQLDPEIISERMLTYLDDETIDEMIEDGEGCICGECLCCMANIEKNRRDKERNK